PRAHPVLVVRRVLDLVDLELVDVALDDLELHVRMMSRNDEGGSLAALCERTPAGSDLLLPARRAFDRGLGATADLDPARLRLLGLRDVDLEHAVLVLGADRALVGALRQTDRAGERAEPALVAVEALARDLLGALALAAHGQRVFLELDGDLVLRDAGQVERVDDLVLGLPHVDGGSPGLARAAVALEQAAHQPGHLVLKRRELTEGLAEADKGSHPIHLL